MSESTINIGGVNNNSNIVLNSEKGSINNSENIDLVNVNFPRTLYSLNLFDLALYSKLTLTNDFARWDIYTSPDTEAESQLIYKNINIYSKLEVNSDGTYSMEDTRRRACYPNGVPWHELFAITFTNQPEDIATFNKIYADVTNNGTNLDGKINNKMMFYSNKLTFSSDLKKSTYSFMADITHDAHLDDGKSGAETDWTKYVPDAKVWRVVRSKMFVAYGAEVKVVNGRGSVKFAETTTDTTSMSMAIDKLDNQMKTLYNNRLQYGLNVFVPN